MASPIWVAVGTSATGKTIKWSSDGITWVDGTGSLFTGAGVYVAYANGIWIALGKDTTASIKYSTDGKAWQSSTNGNFATNGGLYVTYGTGNNWVAVGGTGASNSIKYSSDNGLSWTDASTGFDTKGTCVVYGGSLWVATGYGTNRLKWSTNGTTWTNGTGDWTLYTRGSFLAYNSGTWVAGGDVSDFGGNM